METNAILIIAAGILAFGLVSKRLSGSPVTAPMFFVALGLAVGPLGLSAIGLDADGALLDLLAELTLVLVLFTDASRIDLRLLKREHDLPVRLLGIGLPLTIVLGAAAAILVFPGLEYWAAAVIAVTLAPTDAALGQAVVSNPRVPVRIRQALNVESGLNDGMVLPALLITLSCAGAAEEAGTAASWIRFAVMQVTLGPLVGIGVGWLGGRAVQVATKAGWINPSFERLSAIGLALMSYALALTVGGNGFIAAFFAGLVLGNTARSICTCLYEFAEAEGQLLALLVFLVFGAGMLPAVWADIDREVVLYGALSLTVVRMLPVALSLVGKGLRPATIGFLGWFGPRGIASILFALLVVEQSHLPSAHRIVTVVATTVLMSVVAHGITAAPLAAWYARRACTAGDGSPEDRSVTEMPTRHT